MLLVEDDDDRALLALGAAPAVILSSSREPGDASRAEALGCRAFFVKLVGFPPLVGLVRRIHACAGA